MEDPWGGGEKVHWEGGGGWKQAEFDHSPKGQKGILLSIASSPSLIPFLL